MVKDERIKSMLSIHSAFGVSSCEGNRNSKSIKSYYLLERITYKKNDSLLISIFLNKNLLIFSLSLELSIFSAYLFFLKSDFIFQLDPILSRQTEPGNHIFCD